MLNVHTLHIYIPLVDKSREKKHKNQLKHIIKMSRKYKNSRIQALLSKNNLLYEMVEMEIVQQKERERAKMNETGFVLTLVGNTL